MSNMAHRVATPTAYELMTSSRLASVSTHSSTTLVDKQRQYKYSPAHNNRYGSLRV